MHPTTIAVDLAKSDFQVSVANDRGLVEAPTAHFVLEACATAHPWGQLLSLGRTVSLLPPQYARRFVRRTRTNRSDAEARRRQLAGGPLMPLQAWAPGWCGRRGNPTKPRHPGRQHELPSGDALMR
jgi:transposase